MTFVSLRHLRAFGRFRASAVVLGVVLALALGAFGAPAHAGAIVLEEHVTGGVMDLIWSPGFGTPRNLEPATLDDKHPAYANPSGDHTVGVLTNALPDNGGIALSVVDPGGLSDYTWEGWFFTGDGNTRRGLVLRASPGDDFMSAYQFVLNAGLVNLVFRKLGRDDGASAAAFLAEIEALEVDLAGAHGGDLSAIGAQLVAGRQALETATSWIVANREREAATTAAAAVPYLRLFGVVAGGFLMAKAAVAARRAIDDGGNDPAFCETKIATARFYADHYLSTAPALVHSVTNGAASVLALADDDF